MREARMRAVHTHPRSRNRRHGAGLEDLEGTDSIVTIMHRFSLEISVLFFTVQGAVQVSDNR